MTDLNFLPEQHGQFFIGLIDLDPPAKTYAPCYGGLSETDSADGSAPMDPQRTHWLHFAVSGRPQFA
jgi:hypothetical protein